MGSYHSFCGSVFGLKAYLTLFGGGMTQLEVLSLMFFYAVLFNVYILFGIELDTCFNVGMIGIAYAFLRRFFIRERN